MISFESFKAIDGVPIYQQVFTYVKRGCVAGTINNGDMLPSRRYLSALLGINPMTVQKAFRLLEEEDLIVSIQGSGSVMNIDDRKISKMRTELLADDIRTITESLKRMGITQKEAIELISKNWEENSNE